MNEIELGFAVAFTAGVFSFLSPCVLPLVPSYLTFVTGMSLEDLQEGVNRKATFLHSLLFVMGFSSIFIILGASASFLGQFLMLYEVWIARIGGLIIIVLGLHLAGVFRLTPLMREKRIHVNDKPAGYLGTLGVGMAFGAGGSVSPGGGPGPGSPRADRRRRSLRFASAPVTFCPRTAGTIASNMAPVEPRRVPSARR